MQIVHVGWCDLGNGVRLLLQFSTTLIIPVSMCYYSELRIIITSYSGVQILLTKV